MLRENVFRKWWNEKDFVKILCSWDAEKDYKKCYLNFNFTTKIFSCWNVQAVKLILLSFYND